MRFGQGNARRACLVEHFFAPLANFAAFKAKGPTRGGLKCALVALLLIATAQTSASAQPSPRYAIYAVDLEIAPDQFEAFIVAIKENAAATIHEPGCLQYDVLQSMTNSNEISIYEVYENDQAAQAHGASAHFKKYQAITEKMVVKQQSRSMTAIARNIKPN